MNGRDAHRNTDDDDDPGGPEIPAPPAGLFDNQPAPHMYGHNAVPGCTATNGAHMTAHQLLLTK